jgi:universal stress protein A
LALTGQKLLDVDDTFPARKKRTEFNNSRGAQLLCAGKIIAMKTQMLLPDRARLSVQVREKPIAIQKILAPVDFSSASEQAVKYAQRLAQEFHAELIFLHVLEPKNSLPFAVLPTASAFSEKEMVKAEKNLHMQAAHARTAGVLDARWVLRTGVATHEIVEAAKELDVDLIVIASHGFTGWKHFAIGSTAERVARAAACPVMVVREKEHDFV